MIKPKIVIEDGVKKTVVDSVCVCGHAQSEHKSSRLILHHGPCAIVTCKCDQFSWKRFIYRE